MIALQTGGFDAVVENPDGSMTISISFYVQSIGWCSHAVTIQPTDTTDAIRAAMLQAVLDHAAEKGVTLDASQIFLSGVQVSTDAVATAATMKAAL